METISRSAIISPKETLLSAATTLSTSEPDSQPAPKSPDESEVAVPLSDASEASHTKAGSGVLTSPTRPRNNSSISMSAIPACMTGGQFLPPVSAGGLAVAPSAFSQHHLNEEDEDALPDSDPEDRAPVFPYEVGGSGMVAKAKTQDKGLGPCSEEGQGRGRAHGLGVGSEKMACKLHKDDATACKLYKEDAEWEDEGTFLDDEPPSWVEESEDEEGGGVSLLRAAVEKIPGLRALIAREEALEKCRVVRKAGAVEKEVGVDKAGAVEKDRRHTSPDEFPGYDDTIAMALLKQPDLGPAIPIRSRGWSFIG